MPLALSASEHHSRQRPNTTHSLSHQCIFKRSRRNNPADDGATVTLRTETVVSVVECDCAAAHEPRTVGVTWGQLCDRDCKRCPSGRAARWERRTLHGHRSYWRLS